MIFLQSLRETSVTLSSTKNKYNKSKGRLSAGLLSICALRRTSLIQERDNLEDDMVPQSNISKEDLARAQSIINNMLDYYSSKVVGQRRLGISILIAMMANGHILLESVPGLAKTTAAKIMTEAVNGSFSRIQCTPDLIPSDLIGTQLFNAKTNEFETKIGPVYGNFVLLDEINRSSAKTQSAMLEAMQERSVTIGGKTYDMPKVFVVIATQNPVEQEGTYVLSEAQMDRFLLKIELDYPSPDEEIEILNRIENGVFSNKSQVASIDDIIFLQDTVKKVYIDNSIKKYITRIVDATRHADKVIAANLSQYITMGASTRASIAFMDTAKAMALIGGRHYCTPEDVNAMRYSVLRHRIMLNFAALADGIEEETIIDAIFNSVKTP